MNTDIGHEYIEMYLGNSMNQYGVLGMKWGVHRSKRIINSPKRSADEKKKAIHRLKTLKVKNKKKVDQIEKQKVKLKKGIVRYDLKAGKKAIKEQKWRKRNVEYLARRNNIKYKKADAKSKYNKAKIKELNSKEQIFNKGTDDINKVLKKNKKYNQN